MPSSAFSRARQVPSGSSTLIGNLCAIISGLLIPLGFIVAGIATVLLQDRGLHASPVVLGRYLSVPLPEWLLKMEPLHQLILIGSVGVAIALTQALLLSIFYRIVFHRADSVVAQLHRDTLTRCIEHASTEGVTAQRRRAEHLILNSLPELRCGLIAWYRTTPRRVVILIGCILLAGLVDVWLALLAVVSWLLVWKFYRWLEGMDEPEGSQWELPRSRERLVEMVQEGPMLARLQTGEEFNLLYNAQLQQLMDLQAVRDKTTIRRVPVLLLAATLAIGLLFFALGVNLLDPTSGLTLPAAIVLALSLFGAGMAAASLAKTQHLMQVAADSAATVFSFLDQPTRAGASERLGIGGLNDAIELSHVTLHDGQQQVLANDISLRLEPGSLVALMGSDVAALRAIVELLLGFGRPASGKATLDGMAIADIHPSALGKQVVWVGSDGPIWTGSIEENLRANTDGVTTADLADVTRKVGIYEKIQQLEEGFSAEISPGDSRLEASGRYQVAVARALLAKPAVVIVEELSASQTDLPEDPCLDALQELVKTGTLVVILPHRLRTLRAAERVVLLSNGQIAGEGRHEELLTSSDLYRHLNYQLFNPYRDLK
ncbi:putative ABC transporter ATP-binding protein [Rosistilla oblonga]|uniref:Putative ABC transporter ATP-binding protein n=1 Tax=Rosistilla oblonga TaxID=2527990 RepID=A0A518IQW9_9BACT|nr:putative ABC transporter ATP-binding protein [Rosistilla oblonga]QDV55460.1 putative ABC transporter ATP-binding protein [Rosistilla oblonga]